MQVGSGFELAFGDAQRTFGLPAGALVRFADIDQYGATHLALAGLCGGDFGDGHNRIIALFLLSFSFREKEKLVRQHFHDVAFFEFLLPLPQHDQRIAVGRRTQTVGRIGFIGRHAKHAVLSVLQAPAQELQALVRFLPRRRESRETPRPRLRPARPATPEGSPSRQPKRRRR